VLFSLAYFAALHKMSPLSERGDYGGRNGSQDAIWRRSLRRADAVFSIGAQETSFMSGRVV